MKELKKKLTKTTPIETEITFLNVKAGKDRKIFSAIKGELTVGKKFVSIAKDGLIELHLKWNDSEDQLLATFTRLVMPKKNKSIN